MASRDEILAYARDLLDLDAFPDYGPMGMQVAGSQDVNRIACGVSASLELFERAASEQADLVIVHHGLFWDNESRVVDDRMARRLRALLDARLTLAAYHLALGAHPQVGNNALLARELSVEVDRAFAGGIGVGGELQDPSPSSDLIARLARVLGREPVVFAHGPEPVKRVAIVTGGGARYLSEAAEEGYDLFITGEPAEPTLHLARELEIHFVAGGHYATERLGVQALAAHLAERFGIDWLFIELPNPV
jgi:dinuclear metal center YbgI/SA1388 family protein